MNTGNYNFYTVSHHYNNGGLSFLGKNKLIKPTSTNIKNSLGKKNVEILNDIRIAAKKDGRETYLFGGGVRDCLLGKKIRDLDIMVNGDALSFADGLNKNHPDKYPKVILKPSVKRAAIYTNEGTKIDIVPISKNGEFLNGKKALSDGLSENVKRREYSINTPIIELGEYKTGKPKFNFIDKLHGRKDIKNNILRVVNKDFFMSNPIHALRGLRFKLKYGMSVDKKTGILIKELLNKQESKQQDTPIKAVCELYKMLKDAKSKFKAIATIIKTKSYKLLVK